MLKTGIEFASGTTEECKRLIGQLFQPADLLGAYREAVAKLGTKDIVLVTSEQDPSGFEPWKREAYTASVKRLARGPVPSFFTGLTSSSAYRITQLPIDSEAFWLVVIRRQTIPVMAVLYVTPYKVDAN